MLEKKLEPVYSIVVYYCCFKTSTVPMVPFLSNETGATESTIADITDYYAE